MDKDNAKELNLEHIKVHQADLIGDKDSDNKWYKKFTVYGKKFIQISKDKVALKFEYVIYYCHFHRTLLGGDVFDSKGNKKKLINVMQENFILYLK